MLAVDTLHEAYAKLIASLSEQESVILTPDQCTLERRMVVRPNIQHVIDSLRGYDLTSSDVQVVASRHNDNRILVAVQQRRPLSELLAAAGIGTLMSSQLPHE
jgi:hypothetical protein